MSKNNKTNTNYLKKIFLTFIILLQMLKSISTNSVEDTKTNSAALIPEPEVYKKIMAVKIRALNVLYKMLNETDNPTFAYFYTKTSKNSEIGASMMEMITEKLDFLVNFVLIDCDDFNPFDYKYCVKDPEAKDGFPRMVIYKQPEYRYNPYTKKRVHFTEEIYHQKEVREATIYNFITSFITGKSMKLNSENIEPFLNNNNFNKVLLFTEREETSILYKGISSFFYDKLIFGEIHKNNRALIKRFNVKTFPTILVYVTQEDNMFLDEPRIELYDAGIGSRYMVYFLGQFALKEKMYLTVEKEKTNLEELKYKVSLKDLNKENYQKYLEKFVSKRFIIYLTEDEEVAKFNPYKNNNNNNTQSENEEENVKRFTEEEQQEHLRKVMKENIKEIPVDLKKLSKNTNGFFLFSRFNCGGKNKEFCESTFNIEKFPALLLIHKTVKIEENKPTDNINERLKRPIKLSLDYDTMEKEILNEFPRNVNSMNAQNIGTFLQEATRNKVTPFVYFHEGKLPIGLHLLSHENLYKKYLQINEFSNPQDEIMKNFQLKKIPSAVFLVKDNQGNGDK